MLATIEISTIWETLAARVDGYDKESLENVVILLLHMVEWYILVGKFPANRNECIDALV